MNCKISCNSQLKKIMGTKEKRTVKKDIKLKNPIALVACLLVIAVIVSAFKINTQSGKKLQKLQAELSTEKESVEKLIAEDKAKYDKYLANKQAISETEQHMDIVDNYYVMQDLRKEEEAIANTLSEDLKNAITWAETYDPNDPNKASEYSDGTNEEANVTEGSEGLDNTNDAVNNGEDSSAPIVDEQENSSVDVSSSSEDTTNENAEDTETNAEPTGEEMENSTSTITPFNNKAFVSKYYAKVNAIQQKITKEQVKIENVKTDLPRLYLVVALYLAELIILFTRQKGNKSEFLILLNFLCFVIATVLLVLSL